MSKMKKAIFFILYHPASIGQHAFISKKFKDEYQTILITLSHPYTNPEVLKKYSNSFDIIISLPLIKYEINLARGYYKLWKFINKFNKLTKPLLEDIDSFNLIYAFSAYLPMNAVLSRLNRHKKCKRAITLTDEYTAKMTVDILRTINVLFYTLFFRLYPVFYDKKSNFFYFKPFEDKILLISGPYLKNSYNVHKSKEGSIPIYKVSEPVLISEFQDRNVVVIYGDTNVYSAEAYPCDLPNIEYNTKLAEIFTYLAHYYADCKLIYKPHPSDNYGVMPGLDGIEFELYKGNLTSQVHLESLLENVKACYSVASTSLLYSSAKGIPSYTFYKLLEFKGGLLKNFFESKDAINNPFICNISKIEDIGIIDSVKFEPAMAENKELWDEIMN